MPVCKNGHQSDDPDYCSVCGVAIARGISAVTGSAPAAAAPTAGACPECGTPRSDPDARYCEVCRHDFLGGPGAAPAPVSPPTPVEPAPAPSVPSSAPVAVAAPYQIRVVQDPSLDVDPDPAVPCPGDPEQRYPFDLPELLVGRRDDRRGIYPQVPVRDPGVSHRHANLLRMPDGAVAVRDLASTNGTYVNGNEIPPGVSFVVQPGDVVTLGRWTRLTIEKA
jgi:hypothetical protein